MFALDKSVFSLEKSVFALEKSVFALERGFSCERLGQRDRERTGRGRVLLLLVVLCRATAASAAPAAPAAVLLLLLCCSALLLLLLQGAFSLETVHMLLALTGNQAGKVAARAVLHHEHDLQ